MNELTFKDSMSTCHKIVTDSNGKRYIMDTSTIRPNVYGFGIIPKQVSVDMVEFGYHDQNFEFKAKPSPKYMGAVAATQPLTTITFKMFESIFLKYNIHQQALLKWGIVALTVFHTYLQKFTSNKLRRKLRKDCLKMQNDILQHSRFLKEEIFPIGLE